MSKSHGGGLYFIREPSDSDSSPKYRFYGPSGRIERVAFSRRRDATGTVKYILNGTTLSSIVQEYFAPPAGVAAQGGVPDIRFYDIVVPPPNGGFKEIDSNLIEPVSKAMVSGQTDAPAMSKTIPAIFTYFGQFIAHDVSQMTFLVEDDETVVIAENKNSHVLDFETLFGVADDHAGDVSTWDMSGNTALGPVTGASQTLYQDLPRETSGKSATPDPRSDNNLGVSQLHVLLARYHKLNCAENPTTDPAILRSNTVKFLQSVVLFDYLPRIINECVYEDVMDNGRCIVQPEPPGGDEIFQIPIEFAAACFRFGHSMVRSSYHGFRTTGQSSELLQLLRFTHTDDSAYSQLSGFPAQLPSSWRADWPAMSDAVSDHVKASLINTELAGQLSDLPPHFLPEHEQGSGHFALAQKTLERATQLGLPSAQDLHKHVAGIIPDHPALLGDVQINRGLSVEIHTNTPLWFYTLREAECYNGKLGPLGGRIVMETLHAAIEYATPSVISRDPSDALPTYENYAHKDQFTLGAIVQKVFQP